MKVIRRVHAWLDRALDLFLALSYTTEHPARKALRPTPTAPTLLSLDHPYESWCTCYNCQEGPQ